MKGIKGQILIPIFLAIIIICLPDVIIEWKHAAYMENFYDMDIENPILDENMRETGQGISSLAAAEIMKKNEDSEEKIPMMFYHINKKQTLLNHELNQECDALIYKIKGSSDLLFPDEALLHSDDKKGCLISQEAAWELFRDDSVVGATLTFQEEDYTIRGVIKSKEIFFVCQQQDGEKEVLTGLKIKAETFYDKEVQREQIGTVYGLMLNDNLTNYQKYHITIDRLPNRMSDFKGWQELFKSLK